MKNQDASPGLARARVAFLLTLTLFGITGCSRVRFAYRWADTLIVSKAEDYFDLTSEQKDRTRILVRGELRSLLRDQVPKFNSLLGELIQVVRDRDLKKARYDGFYEDSGKFLLTLVAGLESPVTQFLLQITPKQLEHYDLKVTKEEKEKAEKLRTPEDRRKRLKKSSEGWFDFIGLDLNRDQKKVFEEFLDQNAFPYELEALNEARLHHLFLEAARTPESLKVHLHRVFQDPLKFRDAAFKLAYENYEAKSKDFQWRLYRSLSDDQRKEVEGKLWNWIRQLEELRIEEGVSEPAPPAPPAPRAP